MVSFRRKPESITTGDGGIEPIPSPSASMDPGVRRDDNEMVRRGISLDRDVLQPLFLASGRHRSYICNDKLVIGAGVRRRVGG